MATLREIRRRIGGVKSTQKITKAMKMVAAAKLRRAQDAVIAARPYARKMKELLQHLASVVDVTANPLFAVRPVNRAAIVIVTSDRGLCGAFNSNIIRAAAAHIRTKYGEMNTAGNVKLVVVGRKGSDFFSKNDYTIANKHLGIFAGLDFSRAQAIVAEVVQGYLSGEYDQVEVVYNEFKSIMQQRVVIDQLLPIPAEDVSQSSNPKPRTFQIDYIYEPSSAEIIAALVPKHLNFQMWRILLESNAAEQGARMTAMDNATTNASDLIRDLQLSYNKARQASITKELLEIVSGAEALKAAG
ncbi:MAG: ATP synthase F1 subunit gamma [Ignavibacteriae bacterium]|nr:ATP synthase F1 subunit gamma [Ignavibacteria bacterium]MBI3365383.1 ATP synthase F1 subunit gamma [Ignavibacteriota bacterium]